MSFIYVSPVVKHMLILKKCSNWYVFTYGKNFPNVSNTVNSLNNEYPCQIYE